MIEVMLHFAYWSKVSNDPHPHHHHHPSLSPSLLFFYLSLFIYAQFADEPDIREWIWHHYSIGVKYFYIFDTGSAIPLRQHIQDFIEAGLVQYSYLSPNRTEAADELAHTPGIRADNGRTHWQGAVYNTCLKTYGHRHTFIGMLSTGYISALPET